MSSFQKYFKEKIINVPLVDKGELSDGVLLTDIIITPMAIKQKLMKINPCKSQGPDKVPGRVLKELSDYFCFCGTLPLLC